MKSIKNKMKSINGITLIALVITIIILLILAGIVINKLTNNGIFNRAKIAKEEYENAQDYEEEQITKYTNEIDFYSTRNDVAKQEWKFLDYKIGTTAIDLSEINFQELYIEVNYDQGSINYSFNIPKIALNDNYKNYRNGYGISTTNMQQAAIEVSNTSVKLSYAGQAGSTNGTHNEKTSNTKISVWYK